MSLHITVDIDRIPPHISTIITGLINLGMPITFTFDEVDDVPDSYTAADYATATERVNKLRDKMRSPELPTHTFDDIVNDTLKRAAKHRPFSELVDASPELKKAMAERPEYFQSDEWKARFAVECPTCWSGRGAACVRPTGESYGNKYVHKARLDAYANLI